MKVRYATPDLEREEIVHTFGERVSSDLQEISGVRGKDLEAEVAFEPLGTMRQYVLTLGGLHPEIRVKAFFLPSDIQNAWRVKYRVSKAYAELLRAQATHSLPDVV